MVDLSVKHLVGILYDILFRVYRFIFLANFVILKYEIDAKIPIILGRPFLETGREMVDVETGDMKFWVNEDEVTFNVCKSMKYLSDIHLISSVDVIDKAVANVSHFTCTSDPLEVVFSNYDEFEIQDYDEVVASLLGMGDIQRLQ